MTSIWCANIRSLHTNMPQLHEISFELSKTPDELKAPVNRNSVSRFLDIPPETVRRHCDVLMARGVLVDKYGGLICSGLNRAFRGGLDPVGSVCADALARMYGRLRDDGIALPNAVWTSPGTSPASARHMWVRAVARLTADFLLLFLSQVLRDWRLGVGSSLVLLFVAATDEKATAIRDIANGLGMSIETVRRRVLDLRTRGLLEGDQWEATISSKIAARLFHPALQRQNAKFAHRLFSTLENLARYQIETASLSGKSK